MPKGVPAMTEQQDKHSKRRETIYPYQEGHPSCPIPEKRYDGTIDLHDHRTDEYGSYGTFSHCIMHPRGIMCRNTNRCRPEYCDRATKFKKLGLKGVDYGKK